MRQKGQELARRLNKLRAWQQRLNHKWHPNENTELLEFFMEMLTKVVDAERCSIFIHDPATDEVWLKAGTNLPERSIIIPRSGSNVGRVIATGQSVSVVKAEDRSPFSKTVETVTGFVSENMMCVPIKSPIGSGIPGAIQVLNKKGRNKKEGFTEKDREMLEKAAHHLGMVIENIYMGQEMLDISDKLSGRVDVAEWIIKLWIGFMAVVVAVAFGIIVYFTPHILTILQR
ncbi:MAG: GAF domain-containing protein [Magnetococcales bacterium]|nr:GAF domain-containing protein [Magnetococcales bacterium]